VTRGTLTQTVNFDGFGRVRSVAKTDSVLLPTGQPTSGNSTVTFRYDPLGRRTFQSYPNSSVGITYSYDILDRVKTVNHADDTPAGATQGYTYGATSVDLLNERGKTHTFDYKAFGDPDQRWLIGIRVLSQPSANISFPRNSIGQILNVAQGSVTRTYNYYPANHFLMSITDPETGATVFGRDEVGNMTSRKVGASPMTIFGYDGLNRLTSIDYPAPTTDVTKSYYKDGLLMDVVNGSASRHFEYDPDKNLTLERLIVDGATYEINHTYSPNDGRDTTTYPSGTIVTYTANGFGRPTRADPFLTTVDFHPTGEVKRLDYANGVSTSVSLTGRQWPKELVSSRSAVNLVDIQYAYDGVGNVTRFDDFIDTTNTIPTLGYDDIDRLVAASSNVESRTFGYDGVGNLTSQTFGPGSMTYSYDPSNKLTGITGTGGARSYTFSYDIYGNVASNGAQSFIYNDARQMTCARCGLPDESGYLYDGLDMRVRARKNGVTTYFMYGLDGNLLFETTPQTAGGGVEKKDYVYVSGKQVAVKTTIQVMSTVTPPSGTVTGASGSPVTLTVTVGGSSPTGTVTFMEGSTVLGSAPVANGSASLTIPSLSVGNHSITAVYSGDANNTSSSATVTVNIFDLSWLPAILELLLDD
jgi:YD repeat-containing protein